MTTPAYRALRIARSPLIWLGRWRHRSNPPSQRLRYERAAYRRSSLKAMGNTVVDPHHYHRADLGPDSLVVDVGAFDGQVSQDFVDLYGCEVHAYEPHPEFFARLEARFADEPRVHGHRYGLGSGDAILPLELRGLGSTVYQGSADDPAETVDVEIRDVDRALRELGRDRIDYVKINIEGAEFELLDRMFETGWVDRSRYLLIQFHEWYDGAYLRRWRITRKLRRTHDQVWNYPWIYELWCAKDQPHPTFAWTRADRRKIRAAMKASRDPANAG